MRKELSPDLQEVRNQKAALEATYQNQILPECPPLVAGRAEKLARMNATAEFNAALRFLRV